MLNKKDLANLDATRHGKPLESSDLGALAQGRQVKGVPPAQTAAPAGSQPPRTTRK